MAKEIKTIGVLTSGGDAPGMNAAVRAIVRAGITKGYRMMGIQRGYNGLINGEVYEMNVRSVSEIIHRGGTILYTARCLEFKTHEGQAKGLARCKELGIDALVVIGGDGSFMGARALANQGIPCIGIPRHHRQRHRPAASTPSATNTAMNTAVEGHRQAARHHPEPRPLQRCRGHGPPCRVHRAQRGHRHRRAGRAAARAPVRLRARYPAAHAHHPDHRQKSTSSSSCRRGVIGAQELANQIQAATGVDSRATVLGHIQRGGSPTVRDRVNASLMGYHAVDLLDRGIYNRVVAVSGGKVVDYDVNVALSMHKTIDDHEIEIANAISI